MEYIWRFLKKLKIEQPCDPAVLLLGKHLEKTIIQKDTSTPVFTATLFTIARTWKQEWIKTMWYLYTIEYYSALKESKIMPFAATRIDLEIVILSEVVRYRKTNIIYCLPVESKKWATEQLIYKTEIESQM